MRYREKQAFFLRVQGLVFKDKGLFVPIKSGSKSGRERQRQRETETKREHKAKSNRRNGEFGERRVVPGRFSGPRRGDVIVYHRPNLQSLHPLPHDRESGLGAISREWRDAIVAHGARGRADDGDRVERCIRFEHICSVLGVFAGGACVPRSFFFLSETFGVGARDLSLLSGRESAARKKNTRLTFFSLPFLYRSCTMPPAFVSTPDDKRKF